MMIKKPKFTKSLTAGSSLITKLAMAVITYGTFAGSSLLANVAMDGIESGLLHFVRNDGVNDADVASSRGLKGLGDPELRKAVVRSAATAGIVHGLTAAFSDTVTEAAKDANTAGQTTQTGAGAIVSNGTQAALSSTTTNVATSAASKATELASKTFSECVQTALIQSAADTVVSAAMDGIPLEKLLERGLMSAAINAAAAYGAGGIGGKYNKGEMHYLTHKALHGALGVAFGAAMAGVSHTDARLGAFGSVIGEMVVEGFLPDEMEIKDFINNHPEMSDVDVFDKFMGKAHTTTRWWNFASAVAAFGVELDPSTSHATENNSRKVFLQLLIGATNKYIIKKFVLKKKAGAANRNAREVPGQELRTVLREVEQETGRKITTQQKKELIDYCLKNKRFEKLSAPEKIKYSKPFQNKTFKDALISQWERMGGTVKVREWPKLEKVNPITGIKEVEKFQAHHIIPQQVSGPHTWWNMHPAQPNVHQSILHGSNSKLTDILRSLS